MQRSLNLNSEYQRLARVCTSEPIINKRLCENVKVVPSAFDLSEVAGSDMRGGIVTQPSCDLSKFFL